MYGASYNPFFESLEFFRRFMACGSTGRRFYTRQERIEQLEQIRNRLQQELAGIDELIADLRKADARQS